MASKKCDWLKRTDNGLFARPEVLYQGPNARINFDPEKLARLEKEIEHDGVKQPLIVKRRSNGDGGELQVFDGERRSRCVSNLRENGHEIEWVPVIIRRASEAELMIEAAMTDTGKVKLDFVDQTNLVRMLTGYGLDVKTISERLGVSDTWVRQRLDLIGLEPPAQEALRNKEITLGKALKMAQKGMTFEEQKAEVEKVRERRAKGEKKAGSVIPRPGKKKCREMADEMLSARQLYTGDQVRMIFGWVNGEVTETELRESLTDGVSSPEPAAATVH